MNASAPGPRALGLAVAFVALPWLAPQGWPVLFIAVTLLWTVTSAALAAAERAAPTQPRRADAARPRPALTQAPVLVAAEALPLWLPVFWAGFNLALWPTLKLAPRWGELRLVTVAGMAWAGVMAGGFMAALAQGHVGREGRFCGAVSAGLAGATALRIALVASGGAVLLREGGALWADSLPVLLWAAAALLLAMARRA